MGGLKVSKKELPFLYEVPAWRVVECLCVCLCESACGWMLGEEALAGRNWERNHYDCSIWEKKEFRKRGDFSGTEEKVISKSNGLNPG